MNQGGLLDPNPIIALAHSLQQIKEALDLAIALNLGKRLPRIVTEGILNIQVDYSPSGCLNLEPDSFGGGVG